MDCESDIQALRNRLMSSDFETQIAALEDARKFAEAVSRAVVEGFMYTKNPLIYTDKLAAFGPSIVPDLEPLYASLEEGEAKTSLAILLLYLGSRMGLSDVLGAVAPENPHALLAATKLANAGISEAVEPISNLLLDYAFNSQLDWTTAPSLGTLIQALEKLNAPIPIEVRKRMTDPEVPAVVRAYLPRE